jgi:nucleotide-binding universal stress UspA family protein
MDTILYATDCRKKSTSTLNYAKTLSETLNAKLIVFHIYDVPPVGISNLRPSEHLHNMAISEQRKILEDYCLKNLNENPGKNELTYEVAQNVSISQGIIDKITKEHIDLLLIGMKDEHSTRGFFSGNIAHKLITKNLCPILIVPSGYGYKNIEKIVYASDFESSDILALEKLSAIAESYNAEIEVVHIPTAGEYAAMQQMEWFKELLEVQVPYKKISFHMLLANNVEEGLRMHLEDENAELLVMLERPNKGLFAILFNKDVVKKMESLVTIPILCYNSIS